MYKLKISKVILQKRKEKNITQKELAEYMKVTKASVSKWETGQSYPDILLLPKLATFFNISIDELLGYDSQMSKTQIKCIYETLSQEISQENYNTVFEKCKSTVNNYYSCFQLLFYMGIFLINHSNFAKNKSETEEIILYAKHLFDRICDESDDIILVNQSLNIKAFCLLQIGEAEKALELLPSIEELLISTDSLIASAWLMLGDKRGSEQKLQILIYKNLFNLFNLLLMKLTLDDEKSAETFKRIENLMELFNIKQLNKSSVLNFYLMAGKNYVGKNDALKAREYIEKYLSTLFEGIEKSFDLRGDEYFDLIDNWIENNLLLGKKPPRNSENIYGQFLSIVVNNDALKEIIKTKHIQNMINKIRSKI